MTRQCCRNRANRWRTQGKQKESKTTLTTKKTHTRINKHIKPHKKTWKQNKDSTNNHKTHTQIQYVSFVRSLFCIVQSQVWPQNNGCLSRHYTPKQRSHHHAMQHQDHNKSHFLPRLFAHVNCDDTSTTRNTKWNRTQQYRFVRPLIVCPPVLSLNSNMLRCSF